MKIGLLIAMCCFINSTLGQQEKLDSLVKRAGTQKTDSLKIEQLHKDFFRYVYAKPQLAKQISEYTIKNTTVKRNPYLHAQALIRKGIYYDVTAKTDSALYFYDEAYKIAAPRKDYYSMGNVYNDKGLVYWNNNDLELAMEQFVKGAAAFKKINNALGLSSIYNNIGLILYDLERYEESKQTHFKALRLRQKLKDTIGLGASYSNISNVYSKLKQTDSTRYYMRKAIDLKKRFNDKRGLGIAYENLGIDFRQEKVLDSAIFYAKKAQELFDEIGDGVLGAKNISALAEMYELNGNYDQGIEAVKRAIVLQDTRNKKSLANLETTFGRLLAYKKDYKGSAAAYARAIQLTQDYQETTRTAQAQEYFEKYKTAEKEAEIAKQRAQIAENDLKIKQRNQLIYGISAGLVTVLFLGFLFYRQQQLKAKQREKEMQLQLVLNELEVQKKLHDQRLQISRDLHDNIGSQLTFLVSSIDNLKYAQNLNQQVTSEKLGALSSFIKNTMGELRDTIWAMNKGKIALSDIADRIATIVAQYNTTAVNDLSLQTAFDRRHNPVYNAVDGMHIFRIAQEAIHNAVKYSDATQITVSMNHLPNQGIAIVIQDNGKGFDLQNHIPGNGIKNIHDRAAAIQAVVSWDSHLNKGTTVTLALSNTSKQGMVA